MKKDNVRVKSDITIVDEIAVIEGMVSYYFTDNEYTPYYVDMAKVTVIAENFLDGVEFESEDYVYQLVMENDDIYECVKKFLEIPTSQDKENVDCYVRMEKIMKQVGDIVEFKKQKLIHGSDTIKAIGDLCDSVTSVLNNISEMNSPENIQMAKEFMEEIKKNGITEETLASAARKAADQFKLPESDVIEGQRQRIAEQQEQLKEKEAEIQELRKWRREYMVRNVKVLKGSGKITTNSKKKTSDKTIKDE